MTRLCILTLALNLIALPAFAPAAFAKPAAFAQPPASARPQDQLFTATKQQLDVAKVLLAQEDAWNAGDLTAYLSCYKDAPDTEAILSAPVRGLTSIRSAFRENFPNVLAMGKLEQTDVQVRPLGDNFALATGKYHLIRAHKDGGDATGSFTDIFEKTSAGWQVIFSENT